MHTLDWVVLISTLLFIVLYGIRKTRKINSAEGYLVGNREMPFWMVGLSIMATQASAITFLSTPGMAFSEGMGFVQFYFGLPLAMIILSVFILPRYYELKVYTAYEYLETRLGVHNRILTASLFLIQRGLAAGITIYAPAIILSSILGWSLTITNVLIGTLVIVYTVAGGTNAVSQTQKQQMFVILLGMFVAFFMIFQYLEGRIEFSEALVLAGIMGKMEIVSFEFDLGNRYNLYSAMLGGTFLFLSYFGTDQSQVQRYLSGKSLTESRMGLMFNGLFKIPMQFFILLTGVMVFILFQFEKPPLHFNPVNTQAISQDPLAQQEFDQLEIEYNQIFERKLQAIESFLTFYRQDPGSNGYKEQAIELKQLHESEKGLRTKAKDLMGRSNQTGETKDEDYIFIFYILNFLPIGGIGLLIAVIFSAAMSSTASELNALATTSVVDIYKRKFDPNIEDKKYLFASKIFTIGWGIVAIAFAIFASLFENLIEAVNIIGSLFYGTILGIFFVALFFEHIRGKATFLAAIFAELLVVFLFILNHYGEIQLAYLWLNLIGCLAVLGGAMLLQAILNSKKKRIEH
jgi:Na+/proline symporter